MPIKILESYPPNISEEQSDEWLQLLGAQDNDNEIVGLTLMTLFRKPTTMFDVGSGTGCMVNVWRANRIEAYGVDRLPRPSWPHLFEADLTKPFRIDRQFDMVTCIEVAEHLPEEAADVLCGTLSLLVRHEGILIFTAAQPGQGGIEHFNCQPSKYWRDKLYLLGLNYSEGLTFRTMLALRVMNHPLRHIEANLQVFEKNDNKPKEVDDVSS